MSEASTVDLQRYLDRLHAGDKDARGKLIELACGSLTRLTHKMLEDSPRLKRWEDTDDVFQSATLRLHRALQEVTPGTLREFFRLAALQIRRELIDLARHYYGPQGLAANHHSGAGRDRQMSHSTFEPSKLAEWREFHEAVESLADDVREVFELVWYQELTHADAASVLGVSTKTVQRRWHTACLRLHDAMGGQFPGE